LDDIGANEQLTDPGSWWSVAFFRDLLSQGHVGERQHGQKNKQRAEVRERPRGHRHVKALGVGERLNADHVDFP
jgi:hypothetical protein